MQRHTHDSERFVRIAEVNGLQRSGFGSPDYNLRLPERFDSSPVHYDERVRNSGEKSL